ncbi:MAG: virulence protein [Saccharofermentanales bacterium]
MQIKFQTEGTRRKELAAAISAVTGTAAKYKGPPSFAYAIGDLEVDKTGTIIFSETASSDRIQMILEALKAKGFLPIEEQAEAPDPEPDGFTIELPIEGFTEASIANLQTILSAREQVIKAALGINDLRMERTADTLKFPWFNADLDGEHVKAYTHFLTALCQMARMQNRINASAKDAANERYAFRCFLLRLGFIGTDYKTERKILLSKLSGNSAFKDGPHASQEADNE